MERQDPSETAAEGVGDSTSRVQLFPHTAWSRIHRAGGDGGAADTAMDDLCAIYREPARKYLVSLGCQPQDAEDLTQEFMLRWATRETMQRLGPGTGKLRSYIRQSLRNLMSNARRDAATQRRGGGQAHYPLDDDDLPETSPADHVLDTEWALALLRKVLADLRRNYEARGKGAVFDTLSNVLLETETVQPYAEIGVSLGIREAQVKLEVHRLRRRFGESLRAAVAETVGDPADIDGELRHLLQAASRAEIH